ncbi:laminin EGF-like protein [Cooperia oncophora]
MRICMGRTAPSNAPVCIMENTESCAPDTGYCRCKPGFAGDSCERICSKLFWGRDCANKCECDYNVTSECEPTSGRLCCLPGRTGAKCAMTVLMAILDWTVPSSVSVERTVYATKEMVHANAVMASTVLSARYHVQLVTLVNPVLPVSVGMALDVIQSLAIASVLQARIVLHSARTVFYGDECDKKCDCNGGSCQQKTGKCVCGPGKEGDTCASECKLGHFGFGCGETCSNCTLDGVPSACDSKTGACLKCPIGRSGANCQHSCEDGTWGENCANKCTCADGHKCDPVTGKCSCDHGYTGENCEQKCPEGTWGVECANKCPACVNGAKCNHVDGTCSCPAGYEGRLCNRLCVAGFWGLGCARNCTCASEFKQCDPHTGECACPAGWQGDRCNVPCEDGFYGPDCINKCKCRGTSSASCHRVTGACQCHPGFTGEFCHALCPKGHYGLRCARECGDCGVGYECDAAIGCCHADQLSCGQALLEFQRQQGEGWITCG